jgi:hypothetical protein
VTVICIDPGTTCGIARYEGGRLIALLDGDIADVLEVFAVEKPSAVVFEDSTQQRTMFARYGHEHMRATAGAKVARNVGEIDGYCKTIMAVCAKAGVPCIGVSPERKGAKLTAKQFEAYSGWKGRTNEHQRDAAMLFRAAIFQLHAKGIKV